MIRKMQIADYSDVYNLWLANKGMGLNDVDDSESGIVRFLDRNPDIDSLRNLLCEIRC